MQELCSLGVLPEYRHKGIGDLLVHALIKIAVQDVYLVCIIPDYFKPFGFKLVDEFPEEMKQKLHYCTSELVVEEKYVVMSFLCF